MLLRQKQRLKVPGPRILLTSAHIAPGPKQLRFWKQRAPDAHCHLELEAAQLKPQRLPAHQEEAPGDAVSNFWHLDTSAVLSGAQAAN